MPQTTAAELTWCCNGGRVCPRTVETARFDYREPKPHFISFVDQLEDGSGAPASIGEAIWSALRSTEGIRIVEEEEG